MNYHFYKVYLCFPQFNIYMNCIHIYINYIYLHMKKSIYKTVRIFIQVSLTLWTEVPHLTSRFFP